MELILDMKVCWHIHSFDRFYVVTRIEIPKVLDLNLTMYFNLIIIAAMLLTLKKVLNLKFQT